MKIICSAFQAHASAAANAFATGLLLGHIDNHALRPELVVGVSSGRKEIAVQITGWYPQDDLAGYAQALAKRFNQSTVYVSINGRAFLVDQAGNQTGLGREVMQIPALPLSTLGDRTEYMNGTVMVALGITNTEEAAA